MGPKYTKMGQNLQSDFPAAGDNRHRYGVFVFTYGGDSADEPGNRYRFIR